MKVYLLYTGGTIGSVGDPLAPMSGENFKAAWEENIDPMIQSEMSDCEVTIDYFSTTLDSTNMQPSEWLKMANKIYTNYSDYNAFLILHGTDTMAWTASALSFLLPGLARPVTVSGSQLPLFYETDDSPKQYSILYNTDALRNVLGAIKFFSSQVPEVCLYFADTLFRGNRVVKSNATEFVAFASPNYHELGRYGVLPELYNKYVLPVSNSKSMEDSGSYQNVGKNLETIANNIDSQSVLQIMTFPGYYSSDGSSSLLASMLTQLKNVSPSLAGIVFESYGIGNIPSYESMEKIVTQLAEENKILVDCTQVFAGGVDYNEYATGAWLKTADVVSGHDMTPIAAYAKLVILLALYPGEIDLIKTKMGESLAGELTSYYSISGYQNQYLAPGEDLYSINGDYQFENTIDGKLLWYDLSDPDNPVDIVGEGAKTTPGRLVMQSDNNLVFYDNEYNVQWATGTAAFSRNSYLQLGDDGSLKLYDLDTNDPYYTIYSPKVPVEKKRPGKKKLRKKPSGLVGKPRIMELLRR